MMPLPHYDMDWLARRMANGPKPEFLFFWGHRGRPGRLTRACLSHWWPAPFVVGGDHFATAEHWMMAQKARLFGDMDIYAQILTKPSPRAAKGLGRKVKNFNQEIWDAKKFEIVTQGSLHKFRQNEDIGDFLRATGKKVLVEASPVDAIWGIGLSADDERAQDPARWRGPNLLGFALMAARDRL